MSSEIRELTLDELDGIAGGEVHTVSVGPIRITGGDGIFGLGIQGVGGVLLNTKTGDAEAGVGHHTWST